jgi:hypothetical protein
MTRMGMKATRMRRVEEAEEAGQSRALPGKTASVRCALDLKSSSVLREGLGECIARNKRMKDKKRREGKRKAR